MVKYGYINLTGKRIYMATRKKGDESMIKKFLSILLAVCVLACFVPMDAYAIVGSVRSETEEVTNNKGTYRNYDVTWIENDHMIIPGLFEPPVRTLRATIPENESHIFR